MILQMPPYPNRNLGHYGEMDVTIYSAMCGSIRMIVSVGSVYALLVALVQGAPIQPFKLDYNIKLSGIVLGNATSELRKERGNRYVYKKVAKANGLAKWFVSDVVTERSEWKLVDGQPQSMRFDYTEIDGSEEERESIVFDWSRNKASMTWDKQSREMDISPDTLDRLTLELRAVMDIRSEARQYEYQVAGKGRVKTRRFVPAGVERIELPAGSFDSFKYRLVRDDSKRRSTMFWLAEELGYLPVRMEHHDNKKHFVVVMELKGAQLSGRRFPITGAEDVELMPFD
jgi:hypothetical protein